MGIAMIDWNRVADLRAEIGDDSFAEVAEIFLEETDEVASQLADMTDPADLSRALHFLKGSALNLGFEDLAELCQKGERLANTGQTVAVDPVLECYQTSKSTFLARMAHPHAA